MCMSQIFLTDMFVIWKIMIVPNTGKIDEAIYQTKIVLLPRKKEGINLTKTGFVVHMQRKR